MSYTTVPASQPTHFRLGSIASIAMAALLITGTHCVQADELGSIKDLQIAGKNAEALAKVNQELSAKPKDASLRFLKGVILADTGRTAEAITVFQKLTEDNPKIPEPYNNLAVLYAAGGQFDKAKLALEAAIRTHPSYATAHENLGDVYARMAAEAYGKALQLDVSKTQVQTKLAMIRELGGGGVAASKPVVPSIVAQAKPSQAASPSVPETKQPAAVVKPSQPIQAAKPPEPAKPDVGEVKLVESAVMAWASAWSSRNMSAYYGAYTPEFAPSGSSHKEWEEDRKARIVGKSRISVKLSGVSVKVDGSTAVARFRQEYSADALQANTHKTLTLVKRGSRWLISKEVSG